MRKDSLRDIEERTGIPKSTIQETLTKNGFALRNPRNGKLLMDPKEQIALRKIISLWKAGMSYQAIADELNDKKKPTRSGKPWIRSVVRSIILEAKENNLLGVTNEITCHDRCYPRLSCRCIWQSALDSFSSSQGPDSSDHWLSSIQMAKGDKLASPKMSFWNSISVDYQAESLKLDKYLTITLRMFRFSCE